MSSIAGLTSYSEPPVQQPRQAPPPIDHDRDDGQPVNVRIPTRPAPPQGGINVVI